MKIVPLISVEGVAFGSSPDALRVFGSFSKKIRNSRGQDEFSFNSTIFRFANDRLVEVSFLVDAALEIAGKAVAPSELQDFMRGADSDYFEYVGFAIAPNLGIGYDLSGSNYVSVCGAGSWDELKQRAKKAVPFQWKPAVSQKERLEFPCPVCGKGLRTPRAKICFSCGWNGHELRPNLP